MFALDEGNGVLSSGLCSTTDADLAIKALGPGTPPTRRPNGLSSACRKGSNCLQVGSAQGGWSSSPGSGWAGRRQA